MHEYRVKVIGLIDGIMRTITGVWSTPNEMVAAMERDGFAVIGYTTTGG